MTDTSRLAHFPVAFFAMVMGLFGLTLVWQQAAAALRAPAVIANLLIVVVVGVFAVVTALYVTKAIRYPAAVRAEVDHPVTLSFVPTTSISLILLGTCLLPLLPRAAFAAWATGSALHLILTLFVVNRWMHHEHYQIQHMNPAWFIPAVGNILVPIAGVRLGYPDVSWFFFSVGLVFWFVLMAIAFYRVFFHSPLPQRLLPTLFILVAAPAAGFVAYLELNGELDVLARVLINFALFLTVLLATQVRRFAALRFYLSFWAYSFPLAAMTVAVLRLYQHTGDTWAQWLGVLLIAAVTLLVTWLALKTAVAVRAKQICLPE